MQGRIKLATQFTAASIAGFLLGTAIWAATNHPAPGAVFITQTEQETQVPGDPAVQAAEFEATLVEITMRPYRGFGPPGVSLTVRAPTTTQGWTFYANATAPQTDALQACASDTVTFPPSDWVQQSSGGAQGSSSTYAAMPTQPNRLGPDGDQCVARVGQAGAWVANVCVEGHPIDEEDTEGPPMGLHRIDGELRNDPWDRCWSQIVRVPA